MLGRDATRNPVSPEKGPPLRWQTEARDNGFLLRPSWNLKWEAALGYGNVANPVVAGGLVWVGTNNARPRDPRVTEDAAVLMCFRESDGKFLWQYVSPRLDNRSQDWPHAPICCAPLAEGDRLWFTTNRGEVVCLDVGPLRAGQGEPRRVWTLDMRRQLGVWPAAAAMSIGSTCSVGASYQGRIYVSTGNSADRERGTVHAPEAPSLLCLDKETGKVLWSDASPGKNILHSQWASPLVIEAGGRAQVLAAQGDGWLRSFDARTGKLLWRFDTNPKAARWPPREGEGRNYLPATPVFHQGLVYLANGRSPPAFGPGPGRLYCIDPTKEGDVSPELEDGPGRGKPNPNSAAVWCFAQGEAGPAEQMHGTTASVAVQDGLVTAPDDEGYVHCLDARTGRRYWTHDIRAVTLAAPLIADGKVYIGDDDGMMTVLALSREKRVFAANDLEGPLRSAPVFANGVLYVATGRQLLAVQPRGGAAKAGERAPGHWPQWRGPNRSNVSAETGLLRRWPEGGPALAWKAEGLGHGVASVAVAGGRVCTLGYRDGDEVLTALDEGTGKQVWAVRLGPTRWENPQMRWLCQRTPTVDDDRLYAVTGAGDVVCLRSADGREVWRESYPRDLDGQADNFGWCDRPLVDGDRLVCVPGGKGGVVALDKRTGAVVWKCALPGDHPAGYSTTVLAEPENRRHYVAFPLGVVAGVSPEGKLLWTYDKLPVRTANSHTPLVRGNRLFCASGYGAGLALLTLTAEKDGVRAAEVYARRQVLPPWHDSTLLVGDHVYAGMGRDLACLELATGKVVWRDPGAVGGYVSVTCADDHLYLRNQEGKVALVEANPEGYRRKGVMQIPGAVPKAGSTAPVVAGGRLYLRDEDVLFCYDVRQEAGQPSALGPAPGAAPGNTSKAGPSPGPAREPHDVFVPTPQDVVERMLELAQVRRDDAVWDLGCGDGRIVITAAKKYGCRAAGYDLDPQCVRLSREGVRTHDVGHLVTIEKRDIFTLDLSKADVVTLYLLPRTVERLLPQLARLRPGARIVAHAFALPGLRPDRLVTVKSREDDLEHTIYLWVTPLKPGGSDGKPAAGLPARPPGPPPGRPH
jgi:outer membrane protein assembly factor BamB/precorrin-6B methylase 2